MEINELTWAVAVGWGVKIEERFLMYPEYKLVNHLFLYKWWDSYIKKLIA